MTTSCFPHRVQDAKMFVTFVLKSYFAYNHGFTTLGGATITIGPAYKHRSGKRPMTLLTTDIVLYVHK